jgi:hypothetical protein
MQILHEGQAKLSNDRDKNTYYPKNFPQDKL